MATIQFSNGQTIEFNGTPTQADVEEIATKLGLHTAQTPTAPQPPQPTITDAGVQITPGSSFLGNLKKLPGDIAGAAANLPGIASIGTSLKRAGQNIGLLAQGQNPNIPVDIPKTIGGYLKAGSTVAALANPASAIAKIGVGAGIGAAQGAGGTLENGGGLGDTLKSGAIGGLIGGGLAGTLVGASKLMDYLPQRLVRGSLPKLDQGNVNKVLQDTKLGSVDTMLRESKGNVSVLGSKIEGILTSGKYNSHIGEGARALGDAAASFPRSEYGAEDVVQAVRQVVPAYGKTITALAKGTATIAQKNELRSAIDLATKKIFTDSPQVSATKQLAAALASSLRHEVQSIAPETIPVFADLSKELNLRTALASVAKKLDTRSPINLYSILSFLSGGLPAAIGEEFARSPGVSIAAGKALSKAAPAVSRLAIPASLAGGVAKRNSQ